MKFQDAERTILTAIVGKSQMRGDSVRGLVGKTFTAIIGDEVENELGDIRIGTILGFKLDSAATYMFTTVGKFTLFNNSEYYPAGEFRCTGTEGRGAVRFEFPRVGIQNL